MKLISIVAASENNVIGIDNKMPWHLPDDLKFFKRTTSGYPIIMGKNTWMSIGAKPLPNRTNIIISTSLTNDIPGAVVLSSFEAAQDYIKTNVDFSDKEPKAFIIGGGQLYREVLSKCAEIFMTRIHTQVVDGMVFFPEIRNTTWKKVWEERHTKDEKHAYDFTFEHWLNEAK
ncbi:hypothetical protein DBR32_15075 [Taibaiella sp. KBW10]|uniref:dihydrofolate reductase n=1 Tax=Taibaiella sp. KBW10 TaxID=2153357 RepID=UPI000F5AEC75|nr:dihydrofolate reductase [Taibaiella sp. KBW10]RQO29896.1 hypothetical protein DBR32_15075 [Taibaiella sp. KBW10]